MTQGFEEGVAKTATASASVVLAVRSLLLCLVVDRGAFPLWVIVRRSTQRKTKSPLRGACIEPRLDWVDKLCPLMEPESREETGRGG